MLPFKPQLNCVQLFMTAINDNKQMTGFARQIASVTTTSSRDGTASLSKVAKQPASRKEATQESLKAEASHTHKHFIIICSSRKNFQSSREIRTRSNAPKLERHDILPLSRDLPNTT
jgi:hypothetical protein